jgi:hypothetical protein
LGFIIQALVASIWISGFLRISGELTEVRKEMNGKLNLFSLTGLLLALILIAGGCTHQTIRVNSDPAGAKVYFDGKPKGETPAEFSFLWYGGHKIQLRKEGYENFKKIEVIKAPVHYQVPVDLVTELIPVRIPDRHEFNYQLQAAGAGAGEPATP